MAHISKDYPEGIVNGVKNGQLNYVDYYLLVDSVM